MTFEEFGLQARLLENLAENGITTPTPIQEKAIPLAMEGHDVMGLAQTGTGKTAAFGLPILHAMMKDGRRVESKVVRTLILAPTRELAKQIFENLQTFCAGTHLKMALVTGGAGIVGQMRKLEKGVSVLVATPGRLLDLIDRNALRLDATEFLVLDEADQMLDLGFIHQLRRIATLLPHGRQTMLFSATMPKQMEEIASSYLNKPQRVQVNPPGQTADKIEQSIHYVGKAAKFDLLVELLDQHRDDRALVFGRTKWGMEKLARSLEAKGFGVAAIHGNKSQGQRDRAIADFKAGKTRVLVATDVAARGIDIPDVRYVYNYELPNVPDQYVHRIGRTARAGNDGKAVAFCAPDEMGDLRDIQKTIKTEIPVASGRPWEKGEEKAAEPQQRNKRGGGGGQRRGAPKAGGAPKQGGKPQHRGGGAGKPAQRRAGGNPNAASKGGAASPRRRKAN